ncbi:HNH endonuclease [Sinorhizobium meliloti]|nr:HNH endonuclease [Sinorhizobium meliloti]MDE3854867.1 HNH endonuclease [Sinorhizobium meliloti]MDW9773034.1 HNH endonuclease [Sinorhizobium meliloti]MDW9847593.1 HNH endonuclease [Sinorhizobium meliloti]MDX0144024.1 HNH endonuclease [Sinorhizobium meliloti]
MGRLSSIKPRIRPMKPRLGAPLDMDASRRRDAEQPWRKWYKTADWQRLREEVLIRDMFTCQMIGCGKFMADTSQLVADHKRPHRGDHDLFWDIGNLQCLCKPCHDGLKARQEARTLRW